jgi:hypothetical protein
LPDIHHRINNYKNLNSEKIKAMNDYWLFGVVLSLYVLFGIFILFVKKELKKNKSLLFLASIFISFVVGLGLMIFAISTIN